MRAGLRALMLAILAKAMLLSAAMAQQSTLTGTIVGLDGKPKAFARIQLQGEKQYAAVSDVNGAFTIPNFTTGTYVANVRENDNVQTLRLEIANLNGYKLTVNW